MSIVEHKENPRIRNKFLPFNPDFLSRLVCVLFFFFWAWILLRKYLHFGYYDWDLAFFNQATFNLLHGSTVSTLFDMNFFGNHSNFIAYLCLPVYAIFPHPLTLVYLKVLSVAGGGYLFYLVAKDKLGWPGALFFMLLYFSYPANVYAILYEFDYESLSPAFIFGMYYCFIKNRWTSFVLLMVTLMLIKENMPLIVAAFGIFGLFSKNKNKIQWGVVPLGAGIAAFYLLTTVIIPHFSGSPAHMYLGNYKGLGSSPLGVVSSLILNPWKVLPYFSLPENQRLFLDLFSPVLFLPLLSPQILVLMAPVFLQHVLSQAPTEHTISYQYAVSMAPVVFLATMNSAAYLRPRGRGITLRSVMVFLTVGTALSLGSHWPGFMRRSFQESSDERLFAWKMVDQIPQDKGVMATLSFLAELSSRKEVYAFHKIYHDNFQPKGGHYTAPQTVDYALIDFNDGWLMERYAIDPRVTVERIKNFYFNEDWSLVESVQDIVLLSKRKEGPELLKVFHEAPVSPEGRGICVDQKFSLTSFSPVRADVKVNSVFPLKFFWESRQDIEDSYRMVFEIKANGETVYQSARDIGYRVYPTFEWKKGDVIEEQYNLWVPFLSPGEYTLEVFFINLNNLREVSLQQGNKPFEDQGQRYPLTQFYVR